MKNKYFFNNISLLERLVFSFLLFFVSNAFGQIPSDTVTADFTANNECLGEAVQFNDNSATSGTNVIVNWNWNFGDGNTSAIQNPQHTYAAAGDYTVKLVVTDDGQNKDSVEKTVTIFELPVAGFSSMVNNLDVDFTNESQGDADWLWDFGDGSTSSNENPSHTYDKIDTFLVCLSVTNQEGCGDTICKTINLTSALTADFSAPDECVGEPVPFSDNSTVSGSNAIEEWNWYFGDGNTSTDENPQHTYPAPGNYTVKLIITDDKDNKDSVQKTITIFPYPKANFFYSVDNLNVDFTNASQGENNWEWDFGDDSTSTKENPSHTYVMPGSYTVCLTVTNAAGCEDTFCKSINWTSSVINADFSANDTCATKPVNFNDMTVVDNGTIEKWEWDFGDGNTSSDQNPQYTYSSSGNYAVKLIITDNTENTDSVEKIVNIQEIPVSNFSHTNNNTLTVQFYNHTIGAGEFFWWFNNDSSYSFEAEPQFTFPGKGIYKVCLSGYNTFGCENQICKFINLSTVGIAENKLENALHVFPNPADKNVTLTGKFDPTDKIAIKIINMQGKAVYSGSYQSEGSFSEEIPLNNVAPGLYFIEVKNKDIAGHYKLIVR